jgi:hypothetical protein
MKTILGKLDTLRSFLKALHMLRTVTGVPTKDGKMTEISGSSPFPAISAVEKNFFSAFLNLNGYLRPLF